ncbi:MAG: D-hexose-6-phosphate mutarotase [Armatimonadetes bacterium]|nr:D-hexose-6-phosphate mutarotase [Armatimonadota bacterium]
MMDDLRARCAVPGAVDFAAGINGMSKVSLTHASGSSAEVHLHGAHVTAWRNAAGEDLFFVSRQSWFEADRPIRGGIPVIFPQFGAGPLPQHGFARIREWELAGTERRDTGVVAVRFQLAEDQATLAIWPQRFRLALDVALDRASLALTYRVANTDPQPFDFQAMLHTYFAVGDIRRTALYGLEGVTYIDSLRERAREVEPRAVIRFDQETDRVYAQAPDALRIEDEDRGRTLRIEKRNMPDVTVWNPWIAKAQRMPDFGDDEWEGMLCVETGIARPPHALAPGEEWVGETTFTIQRG